MPKRAAPIPNVHIHTTLPPEIATRLEIFLWSESENRVPRSALQSFLVARINEFFSHTELDLAPYLGSNPGHHTVSAREDTITILRETLAHSRHL